MYESSLETIQLHNKFNLNILLFQASVDVLTCGKVTVSIRRNGIEIRYKCRSVESIINQPILNTKVYVYMNTTFSTDKIHSHCTN